MSRAGLWVAGVYVLAASWISILDARDSAKGGILTMIGAFFVTFPVSAPLSMVGMEPKLESPFVCGLMILLTAGVVYGVVAGIGWVWGRIW